MDRTKENKKKNTLASEQKKNKNGDMKKTHNQTQNTNAC